MTLLSRTTVSRKTPVDGRLEILESLADRLSTAGGSLTVLLGGDESSAAVEEMACTCAKGQNGDHVHHFLASEILKSLPVGANVSLTIDLDRGDVHIELDN